MKVKYFILITMFLLLVTSVNAQNNPADTNNNGCVDIGEIVAYVDLWKNGQVSISQVVAAVEVWKLGCSNPATCSDGIQNQGETGVDCGGPCQACTISGGIKPFGTVKLDFDYQLGQASSNMDSIAFWEAPNPADTLMFVTSRDDALVEVWRYPFKNSDRLSDINPPVNSNSQINGVFVDQDLDRVYASESTYKSSSARNRIHVYDASSRSFVKTFGSEMGSIRAEVNMGILTTGNAKMMYTTTDNKVWAYDLSDYSLKFSFNDPGATTLEEVYADDYYQRVYVMDENNGGPSRVVDPNGNVIGQFGGSNVYDADQEGVTIYTCPESGIGDDGRGWIIVSDQRSSLSDFEFFNRKTYEYLGRLQINGVGNTDGIASTQLALPDYPKGLFAVMDNDKYTAILGWDKILAATGLSCD